MRVLRVVAPGAAGPLVALVRDGIVAFNAELDIRLRFLAIVIEERELVVDGVEDAALRCEEAFGAYRPDVVALHGEGPAAVAAATAAVRAGRVLVRVGAGRRDGPDADAARAVDRLAHALVAFGDGPLAALREEGLAGRTVALPAPDAPGVGRDIIKALRSAHARGAGDATC